MARTTMSMSKSILGVGLTPLLTAVIGCASYADPVGSTRADLQTDERNAGERGVEGDAKGVARADLSPECCAAHGSPGCNNTSVAQCVCAADSYCCSNQWDGICVNEVSTLGCGTCPTAPSGDCYDAQVTPGCEDWEVAQCVCASDSYCCGTAWDYQCVQEVTSLGCDDPAPCCSALPGVGCSNTGVAACVCASDSYCCTTNWDGLCASEVASYGCGTCPTQSAGTCWEGKSSPGCNDYSIAQCVCAQDSYCCNNSWDGTCVNEVTAYGCSRAAWTFLVYMSSDNNLDGAGLDDLAEMGIVGSHPDVQIIVLQDRLAGPANILRVTQGGTEVVASLGEVNMGDPQTLADFGIWGIQHYPADHYVLDMWDHGDGWRAKKTAVRAFSWDDTSGGAAIEISNGEYAGALDQITSTLGRKLDLVAFDACQMGMWEVAEASAPYADYFVGSEENVPGPGFRYDLVTAPLANNPAMNPRDLATLFVDAYTGVGATLAATDLATVPTLRTAVSSFANELIASSAQYWNISNARNATQTFSNSESRDLRDFATRVAALGGIPAALQTAANGLVTQLNSTIIRNYADASYPNANGLSIHLPPWHNGALAAQYTDVGAVWSNSTWDEFLVSFGL